MDIVKFFKNSINLYFEKKYDSYNYIHKKISWWEVFLTFLILGVFSAMISFIFDPAIKEDFSMAISPLIMLVVFVIVLILMAFMTFFSYGILHLILKLFGAKGSFKDTFKFGMSISIFPSLVFIVLGILPLFFQNNIILTTVFSVIMFFIAIVFFIWTLIISGKIYSKVHDIALWKAIVAMLVPFVFFVILIFMALMLYVFMVGVESSLIL